MSNPNDDRLVCLDFAIKTPGVSMQNVVGQAQKYYEFVSGVKAQPKVPAKRNRK